MNVSNWKTEEEARKTVCPLWGPGLVVAAAALVAAGHGAKSQETNCNASECAMWAWKEPEHSLAAALQQFKIHGGSNVAVGHVNRALKELCETWDNPKGGCGLRRVS